VFDAYVDEEGFFETDADAEAAYDYFLDSTDDEDPADNEEYEGNSEILGDGKNFHPKPNHCDKRSFTEMPDVTFDKARTAFWEHDKKEIDFLRRTIQEFFLYDSASDVEKIAHILAGFFGLWRATNRLDKPPTICLPIPKTARIVPFNVAAWNTLKGGSDTITKLIELCQEKIGVRTENNVASAHLLLYFGVVFHRLYQIVSSSENFDDYGTIYHWCNAASHQSTFAESLELFIDTLLDLSLKKQRRNKSIAMPDPTGVYEASPRPDVVAAVKSRSSAKKSTPQIQKLPPGRASLGATLGQGQGTL